jgi:zinc D-Ala-D-Ala dipeptidase
LDNFTGSVVPGYSKGEAQLSIPAHDALLKVVEDLSHHKLGLIIFDAYRPVKAVEFFLKWASMDETREDLKKRFYPDFTRTELFSKGYLAKRSSHSRGSTVDLGLWDLKEKKELDMGSEFDFFHETSHTKALGLSKPIQERRQFLCEVMSKAGFRNYAYEWWHFTLQAEPYPENYFDHDT